MANDIVPYGEQKPAQLVDAGGRPLRAAAARAALESEIAAPSYTSGRSIQTAHPAEGLTPERLSRILRQAENGDATAYLELAEQMEEKDLHYLSVLGTRKRAIAQLPISVDAASEDKEDEADAQLVRDWLERDTLEGEIFDMLDSIGKGFSATELVWDLSSQPWLPSRLVTRDQRFFEHDQETGQILMLKGTGGPQALSPAKWIIHASPAKTGLPIRGGLARPVAWAYLFRNYGIKDWVRFNEAYGMPFRVAKYEGGTSEPDIRKMLRALHSMSADFAGVFPRTAEVEFINGGDGAGALFERLLVYFEQQISKAVLGQTATTDAVAGGLGSGQATAHNDVRGDIERADAKALAATLNRDLVPWIVTFNRGPRKRYPRIRIGRPEAEDIDSFLKVVDSAVKHGVSVGVSTFRKMTGLAEPKPGEELLAAPAPETPPGGPQLPPGTSPPKKGRLPFLGPLKAPKSADEEGADVAFSQPELEPDEIDVAAAGALAASEAMMAPVLAPIRALLDEVLAAGGSFEEFRDRLAALAPKLDVRAIREQLARATFAARLAGDADTPGEE